MILPHLVFPDLSIALSLLAQSSLGGTTEIEIILLARQERKAKLHRNIVGIIEYKHRQCTQVFMLNVVMLKVVMLRFVL